jgi:signal transduction histidine kinase
MDRSRSSRALIAVSCALAVLLGVMAVQQYRWATRVAEADAQRTQANLESAASLFTRAFDLQMGQLYSYLQNQGSDAVDGRKPLENPPRLLKDVFHLSSAPGGAQKIERLERDGTLTAAAPADPAVALLAKHLATGPPGACASNLLGDVPALVAPLRFQMRIPLPGIPPSPGAGRVEIRAIAGPNRCLVGRLDEDYLRQSVIPEMIQRYFGESAAQYDFAVVRRDGNGTPVYGSARAAADVKRSFFALRLEDLIPRPEPAAGPREASKKAPTDVMQHRVMIQSLHTGAVAFTARNRRDLPLTGYWELQVARKGGPISSAVVAWRRQNVLLSLSVEALLLVAIGFLVISTRRMQKLAEQKMQFVAGVSHELRTPVSAIAMLSRNQADGLVSDPEQVQQYGALILQQSQRLGQMVEQALQYAGIQSGLRAPSMQNVDLRRVIEDTVAASRERLDHDGFVVETEIEEGLPPVRGDSQWLAAAIGNLLSNAEKYANGRRWIRISARRAAGSGEVQVTVEDRGIGIDPADFDQIFEPFCRGRRAVEAQIPGTGIGLSLVRDLAAAHRGRVTFTSEPDRGSAFTLHLPPA